MRDADRLSFARNVPREPLACCCEQPRTGLYRDGCCHTGSQAAGSHTVCARMTAAFPAFSRVRGDDLGNPRPEFASPGLRPGNRWCLGATRWREAPAAGRTPPVVLPACHERALEFVTLAELRAHALDVH